MTDSGHELRDNNEQIVKLISQLKKQRKEMNFLIEKQELEKGRIQTEIEKLSFKLTLLSKSLGQRVKARTDYDQTIKDIEANYGNLVEESGKLLFTITREYKQLEQIMDKKIGTSITSGNDKIKVPPYPQPPPPSHLPQKPQPPPQVAQQPELPEEGSDVDSVNDDEEMQEEKEMITKNTSLGGSDQDDGKSPRKGQSLTSQHSQMSQTKRTSGQSTASKGSNVGAGKQKKRMSQSTVGSNSLNTPPTINKVQGDKVIDSYREAYVKQHSILPGPGGRMSPR